MAERSQNDQYFQNDKCTRSVRMRPPERSKCSAARYRNSLSSISMANSRSVPYAPRLEPNTSKAVLMSDLNGPGFRPVPIVVPSFFGFMTQRLALGPDYH